MRTFVRNSLVALGVGALGFTSPVTAQDFKSALPEGTILYMGAPDLPAAMEAFKTSALFKMWQEEEVQEFFEDLLEEAQQRYEMLLAQGKQMHQAGMLPIDPEEILKIKVQGVHLAMTELAFDMQKGNKLNLCVCIDFGQSGDKVKALLTTLVGMAQGGGGMPEITTSKLAGAEMSSILPPMPLPMAPPGFGIHWGFVGGKFVLGTSQSGMKSILEALAKGGLEKNLTTSKGYTAVASKTRPQPYGIEAFVRPESLWTTLWSALELAKTMDPDMAEVNVDGIKRAVDALGLLNTKSFGMTSSYENGKGVDRLFFNCEGEAKGLMKVFGDGDIDQAQLAYIPKDASSFNIGRVQLSALYDSILAAVAAYDKDLGEMVTMQLGQVEEQLGISLRDDLFANLGPEALSYAMPVSGQQLPEMGILMQVKNAAKALKVIKTAAQMSQGRFGIREIETEGGKLYALDMDLPDQFAPILLMMEPTFTFHKGYMVIGLTRGDVRAAVKMLDGEGGASIKENKAFASYLERIPAKVSGLSWADTAANFEGVYGMLASAAGFIPLPDEVPIELGMLPSTEVLTQHLFGSLSYSKKLPDGVMLKQVGPVGPEIYVALGLAVGIGIPAAAYYSRQANAFPGGGRGGMFKAPAPTTVEVVEEEPEEKAVVGEDAGTKKN